MSGWLKALIPKSALTVEEEAWNAYPYTKTRYKCPFVDKFTLEIETYYFDDSGDQENVFQLKDAELRDREIGEFLRLALRSAADHVSENTIPNHRVFVMFR